MRNWLTEALLLAEQAAREDEVPVGALVISGDKVIGEGYNRREQDQNPLAHAEMIALEKASKALGSWRLDGCELYVTLEPCPMCLAACQQARVKRVIYGASDAKGGAISLGYRLNEDKRTNHRFSVELKEEFGCGQILKDFFAKKRQQR